MQNRHLGETAQFWISLMVDAKLVFLLTQTVKMNNMKLFHECNGEMATLLFTFDRKIIFIFSNTFIFKQHSSGKTIDRHYDKRKRFFFFFHHFFLWCVMQGSFCEIGRVRQGNFMKFDQVVLFPLLSWLFFSLMSHEFKYLCKTSIIHSAFILSNL